MYGTELNTSAARDPLIGLAFCEQTCHFFLRRGHGPGIDAGYADQFFKYPFLPFGYTMVNVKAKGLTLAELHLIGNKGPVDLIGFRV